MAAFTFGGANTKPPSLYEQWRKQKAGGGQADEAPGYLNYGAGPGRATQTGGQTWYTRAQQDAQVTAYQRRMQAAEQTRINNQQVGRAIGGVVSGAARLAQQQYSNGYYQPAASGFAPGYTGYESAQAHNQQNQYQMMGSPYQQPGRAAPDPYANGQGGPNWTRGTYVPPPAWRMENPYPMSYNEYVQRKQAQTTMLGVDQRRYNSAVATPNQPHWNGSAWYNDPKTPAPSFWQTENERAKRQSAYNATQPEYQEWLRSAQATPNQPHWNGSPWYNANPPPQTLTYVPFGSSYMNTTVPSLEDGSQSSGGGGGGYGFDYGGWGGGGGGGSGWNDAGTWYNQMIQWSINRPNPG